MTPVSETDWEPVALEEAYKTVMLAMEANYSKIRTWSGECEEVIFNRYDQGMTEKSHLVRFELEVQASKGGAVQTTSVKPGLMKFEEEPIFREEAVFYTPFFFGRQNELHWKRMEKYLQHFRRNAIPEARRFILAYRAADHRSGLWKFEKVYTGIRDKLLVRKSFPSPMATTSCGKAVSKSCPMANRFFATICCNPIPKQTVSLFRPNASNENSKPTKRHFDSFICRRSLVPWSMSHSNRCLC